MYNKPLIVILQRLSPVGGIETLVLRLLPYLIAAERRIVIFGTDIDSDFPLPSEVKFIRVEKDSSIISVVPKYFKDNDTTDGVIIVSLHPWSLLSVFAMRYRMPRQLRYKTRSFHLVTHSRAMFFSGPRIVKSLIRSIFLDAPAKSTFFMNVAARDAHESEWNTDLSAFPVLKLPIDQPEGHIQNSKTQSKTIRIVSVGRLVDFKSYNFGAAQIASELINSGIDVKWDIWGDGADREIIEKGIANARMEGVIVLKGTLPYANFSSIVSQADCFVGMGTALLEAAQLGVPAICAVETAPFDSYGFFHEVPLDSLGDIVPRAKRQAIAYAITRLAAMSATERSQLAESGRRAVETRSATLSQFCEQIESAELWPVRMLPKELIKLALVSVLSKIRDVRVNSLGS